MKYIKTCGECEHLTNVPDELRKEENVMGGCFITGLVMFTDCPACRWIKPIEDGVSD